MLLPMTRSGARVFFQCCVRAKAERVSALRALVIQFAPVPTLAKGKKPVWNFEFGEMVNFLQIISTQHLDTKMLAELPLKLKADHER